jgi:exodeoxyribonuclease VII small subunit
VQRLEQGELPLEESLRQFERGVALTRSCQKALRQAEQKIRVLSKGATASSSSGTSTRRTRTDRKPMQARAEPGDWQATAASASRPCCAACCPRTSGSPRACTRRCATRRSARASASARSSSTRRAAHRRRADALDAPAAAVELIHAYSLVHDDLPAMDDDDLRARPPDHAPRFDEATAILAGDALQVLAFRAARDGEMPGVDDAGRIAMIRLLAHGERHGRHGRRPGHGPRRDRPRAHAGADRGNARAQDRALITRPC